MQALSQKGDLILFWWCCYCRYCVVSLFSFFPRSTQLLNAHRHLWGFIHPLLDAIICLLLLLILIHINSVLLFRFFCFFIAFWYFVRFPLFSTRTYDDVWRVMWKTIKFDNSACYLDLPYYAMTWAIQRLCVSVLVCKYFDRFCNVNKCVTYTF